MKSKNIKYNAIAAALILAGFSTLTYAATPISVTASSDDGNVAENTIDNDPQLSTRWSAQGSNGSQWLEYDFGSQQAISGVEIAFYRGNNRSTSFKIESSNDAQTWTTEIDTSSSGESLQHETFEFSEAVNARYIRYVGFGNSSNAWNSVTDITFTDGTVKVTPPASGSVSVPSLIQAEDYVGFNDSDTANRGGEYRSDEVDVQITKDEDGGYNVGWINSGEWLEYPIYVSQSGDFTADIRVASQKNSGAFDILVDGSTRDSVDVGYTGGWQAWETRTVNLGTLSAGDHIIRINMTGSSFNLNWIDVNEIEDTVEPTEPTEPTEPVEPVEPTEPTQPNEPVTGETYTATPDSLNDVLAGAVGGDEIIVTGSGEISLKDLNFDSQVLIRAASIGGTTLTNATISNTNNVTLQGFVFGPNDESTLVKIVNSTNVKILRNLFDHKDITESQSSIVMTQASQYIEIGYNEFKDKNLSDRGEKITGSYIKTQFDDPLMTKDVHIHHNHFNNIAPYLVNGVPAGDSDREVIAMGIADSQDVITNNVIEYNLFENCDGENEIITVKTSNNVFRYNTFKNSMGSLSFRLGSNNEAYGNYFYGTGTGNAVTDDNYQTGGVRVYGAGHKVYDNYMQNLTGISWRRPILIDSGDTSESTGNDSHETSTNIEVYNNTIVDSIGGGIHIGGDVYSNVPTDITITDNTVISSTGILFNNVADRSSNLWSGNKAYASGDAVAVGGASLNSSQVQVLSNSPTISAPTPLTASDVGTAAE